jgi:hypothetical protein
MAIARSASVTVSIAADIRGMFSLMFFVRMDWVSVSLGNTSEYPGSRSTSS